MSYRRPALAAEAIQSAIARRHRPDYQIILFMGILVLVGLVVLFAISPARVELLNQSGSSLDQAHFMRKQVAYLVMGLAAFGLAATIPLGWWRRYALWLLGGGLVACLLLALLGLAGSSLALCANGACRWFNLGLTTFQPAELLKFGIYLFTAGFLARRVVAGQLNDVRETLVPLGVIVVVACLFIVGLQKDMGTGITLIGLVLSMLLVAGVRYRLLALAAAAILAAGMLAIVVSPHRIARVGTFLSGGSSQTAEQATGADYHVTMANIAIGSGGLTGKGLGESIQAFGYLPEAVNDSIFAILGETFGFIGLSALLAVFVALFFRLLHITERVSDPYQRLLVAGTLGWLATHTVVNVGAMTGVFPLTGVTLPFLSFGGTSLLFTMIVLGVAFQVSRYTSHTVWREQQENDDNRGGEGYEGARRRRGLGRPRDPR